MTGKIGPFFQSQSFIVVYLSGAVVVPGGFFGNLLGGYIIKKFRLRCSGIIMVGLVCQLISLCLIFGIINMSLKLVSYSSDCV